MENESTMTKSCQSDSSIHPGHVIILDYVLQPRHMLIVIIVNENEQVNSLLEMKMSLYYSWTPSYHHY